MNTTNKNYRSLLSVALAASCLAIGMSASVVDARGGGGHRGGGGARASAHTSVNRPSGNRGGGNRSNVNSGNRNNINSGNRNNVNINNNNVNVNRNTNINVDVDNRHGGGWNHYDDHYHPVARGVAIGATAAVTAAVVGSIVYSIPPSCTTVIVNGISYSQCGSTWYQPRYSGSSVQYVVVNSPN